MDFPVGARGWIRWNPVILILAALVVRGAYLFYYSELPDWEQLNVDNYYFHHWAESIAGGNLLGDTTYFRAPLYSLCLGLLYFLAGTSLWVSRLFGLAVGIGSIIMTYLLGRRIFGHRIGFAAAALQIFVPTILYLDAELLSDPLFTLLLQLAVFRSLIWFDGRHPRDGLLAGLSLGMACVTRPTALVFVGLFGLLFWLRKGNLTGPIRGLSLFCLGVGLVVATVFVRNLIVADDPVLIASQGGINLFIGNHATADGVSSSLPEPLGSNWRLGEVRLIAERELGRPLKPGEVSSFWIDRALEWIAENPGAFALLYLKKLYHSVNSSEVSNNRNLPTFFRKIPLLDRNPIRFGYIFCLAVVGAAAGWSRSTEVRTIVLVICTYIAASALFFFSSRFRLPMLPFYLILAASGAAAIFGSVRRMDKQAVRLLLAGATAALVTFSTVFVRPAEGRSQPYTSRGLHYFAESDYEEALAQFRTALEIEPDFPEVNLNMGNCFLKLGKGDLARGYLERETSLHPNRAKSYVSLASLALTEGNFGKARDLASVALDIKPYDVTANQARLRAVAGHGEFDVDSLYALVLAALERTHYDISLANEASIILTQRGEVDHAEQILLQALAAKPPPVETDDNMFSRNFRTSFGNWEKAKGTTCFQLGYIYGRQARYSEAIDFSQRAILKDSSLADAYINLASGYLSIGQPAKADSVLRGAARRFPANESIKLFYQSLNGQ